MVDNLRPLPRVPGIPDHESQMNSHTIKATVFGQNQIKQQNEYFFGTYVLKTDSSPNDEYDQI